MSDDQSTQSGRQTSGSLPMPSMNRGIKGFVRDLQREMRQVTWPTRQEATRLSGVVLAICVLIAVLLTGLSLGFEVLLKAIGLGGR
jgi:preprotein translocase SecE subunit